MIHPPLSRREFLRLTAYLQGLGLCGCTLVLAATAEGQMRPGGPGPGMMGGSRAPEPVDLGEGPSYGGPLIDCHSHVITRVPPGLGVTGFDESSLVRALGEAGMEKVVGFGAGPGSTEGGRLVPVYVHGSGLPFGKDLRSLLADGAYRGLKMAVRHFPFPMKPEGLRGRADDPGVRELAALAGEVKVPLTLHLDGPDVEDLGRLCAEHPTAPIVWAHAGGTPSQFGGGAPAATVGKMLDAYPNLLVDLSARAYGWMGPLAPVTPGAPLLPAEWREVIARHASRVLFGIDLFMTRFLPLLPQAVRYWRRLLGELPGAVAEQVAHQNARRLYRL